MGSACSTSTRLTRNPLRLMPSICLPMSRAASGVSASFTPPALPRPPTWTCALITTRPPISRAMASTSSSVSAALPFGTGSPYDAKTSLAWYSYSFTRNHCTGGFYGPRRPVSALRLASCRIRPDLLGSVPCKGKINQPLYRQRRSVRELACSHEDALHIQDGFCIRGEIWRVVIKVRGADDLGRELGVLAENSDVFVGLGVAALQVSGPPQQRHHDRARSVRMFTR